MVRKEKTMKKISFTHSFNCYLLGSFHKSISDLEAEEVPMNKTKDPHPWGVFIFLACRGGVGDR